MITKWKPALIKTKNASVKRGVFSFMDLIRVGLPNLKPFFPFSTNKATVNAQIPASERTLSTQVIFLHGIINSEQ